MQSNIWGKHAWEFFHIITFNYPIIPTSTDKQQIKCLFDCLGPNLPCCICRDSFAFFYKYLSINNFIDSRYGIVYWLYIIHTIVNFKLNKNSINFADVIKKYEALRVSNKEPVNSSYINDFIQKTEKYNKIMTDQIVKMLKENQDKDEVKKIVEFIGISPSVR